MSANPLQGAIRRLASGENLSSAEVTAAFDVIMRGEGTHAQIAAMLVGLRVKGESADEVAGVARSLRASMIVIHADRPDELVDTCGTGGGVIQTFNISTAAALVAAGAGVRIAKHGNRSFTSRSGSADVLESLGIPLDAPPEALSRTLREAGIVFMFAPMMHPAMRHVGAVRSELGITTVMNIVGPLANPAGAGRQIIGVADVHRMPLIAGALAALGVRHALVVHGELGLDEISPVGPSRIIELRDGELRNWRVDPEEMGIPATALEDLAGGTPAENAARIIEVLGGGGPPGARAAVQLNAAAAIYVSGGAPSLAEAASIALAALDAGLGLVALERMRAALLN